MEYTKENAHAFFDYHSDGTLTHKTKRRWLNIGDKVGYLCSNGYLMASNGYPVHRLIWIWHHGAIPTGYHIDHIDRNKRNNRVENLRAVPPIVNVHNIIGPQKNNTSGMRGVRFDKRRKRYVAMMMFNRVHIYLGQYTTLQEASAAYEGAVKLMNKLYSAGKLDILPSSEEPTPAMLK
jgi:hypothetical protein